MCRSLPITVGQLVELAPGQIIAVARVADPGNYWQSPGGRRPAAGTKKQNLPAQKFADTAGGLPAEWFSSSSRRR